MTNEERVLYWTTSQPDCTREEALAIIAQEDAEVELDRVGNLLYQIDEERLLRMIQRGLQKLAEAVEAERVRSPEPAASY